jgi:hypothetical protein
MAAKIAGKNLHVNTETIKQVDQPNSWIRGSQWHPQFDGDCKRKGSWSAAWKKLLRPTLTDAIYSYSQNRELCIK